MGFRRAASRACASPRRWPRKVELIGAPGQLNALSPQSCG
jgi:hypothetical protein